MLDPACTGGRLISFSPARGPEESKRRSLQILDTLTAIRLSTPENWTKDPGSWLASMRLGEVTSGMPVSSPRWSQASPQ